MTHKPTDLQKGTSSLQLKTQKPFLLVETNSRDLPLSCAFGGRGLQRTTSWSLIPEEPKGGIGVLTRVERLGLETNLARFLLTPRVGRDQLYQKEETYDGEQDLSWSRPTLATQPLRGMLCKSRSCYARPTQELLTDEGKGRGSLCGLNEKYSKEIELNRRYFIVGERRISSYWWASVFFVGGLGFLITGISSYIKYNLFTNVYRVIESFINNDFFQKCAHFFKTLSSALFSTLETKRGLPTSWSLWSLFPEEPKGIIGKPLLLLGEGVLQEAGQNASISITPPFVMEGTGGESLVFFPQGLLLCFYGSLALLLSLYWWLLIYWNVGGGFNEFNKKEGFMRIFRWGYPGKNRRIDIVYPLKDIEAIRVELSQSPGSSLLTAEQTIFVRLLSTETNPSVINKELGETYSQEKGLTPLGKLAPFSPELVSMQETYSNKGSSSIKKGNSLLKVATLGGNVEKIKREIPLGGIGQPLTLKEIEKQASELANYLQVALEGL